MPTLPANRQSRLTPLVYAGLGALEFVDVEDSRTAQVITEIAGGNTGRAGGPCGAFPGNAELRT